MSDDAKSLREQSLKLLDQAMAARGPERALMLDMVLKLHQRAREAEAATYPAIADDLTPEAPAASDEEPSLTSP